MGNYEWQTTNLDAYWSRDRQIVLNYCRRCDSGIDPNDPDSKDLYIQTGMCMRCVGQMEMDQIMARVEGMDAEPHTDYEDYNEPDPEDAEEEEVIFPPINWDVPKVYPEVGAPPVEPRPEVTGPPAEVSMEGELTIQHARVWKRNPEDPHAV